MIYILWHTSRGTEHAQHGWNPSKVCAFQTISSACSYWAAQSSRAQGQTKVCQTVNYICFLWNCHLRKHWNWMYCLLPISMILKRGIATNLAKCNVAIITGINCPFSYRRIPFYLSSTAIPLILNVSHTSHARIFSLRSRTPGSILAGSWQPPTSPSCTRPAPTGPTPTLRWWTLSR